MQTVYFVTNRDPLDKNERQIPRDRLQDGDPQVHWFGDDPSPAGFDDLRFGRIEVDQSGVRRESIKVFPDRLGAKRAHQDVIRTTPSYPMHGGSLAFFEELRQHMCGERGRDTLVFVHGFANDFEGALRTSGRLAESYGTNIVLFSWPADRAALGVPIPFFHYKSDRSDATSSGPAFGRALLKLRDFISALYQDRKTDVCRARLHLACHSMGNYVLREGLRYINLKYPRELTRIFDQAFLFAADEDHDTFEHPHKLGRLGEAAEGVTVYIHLGDDALGISQSTKNDMLRLGKVGPRNARSIPENVAVVDVTSAVGDGVFKTAHSYMFEERVVRDVGGVLGRVHPSPSEIEGRRYQPDTKRFILQA